ncbi:MAG: DivIVA domain-containing protein [Fimbriimonadaceae bacterium]|nr:DivIVA domain-containing protein [Fimbriimonadaceae bacterium]
MNSDLSSANSLPRAFRGYRRDAVETLIKDYESQIGALADRVRALEGELAGFKSQEQTLKDAVIRAQREYDDALVEARQESERILEETRRHAAEIEEQHEARLLDLRWGIEKLQLEKKRYLSKFRTLLEDQLSTVLAEQTPTPTHAIVHGSEEIVLTEAQLDQGSASASGE